jgi:hypothetical protein
VQALGPTRSHPEAKAATNTRVIANTSRGIVTDRILAWARHGTLFDRPDRLSRDPIEDVEKAGLPRHGNHRNRLPVVTDGGQLRRRGVVVVPEIVMDVLEVPEAFSGPRIERQQAAMRAC